MFWLLFVPVVRLACRPLTVRGAARVPADRRVVFVANHASHLDTLALLRALPAAQRRRLAPAAAEDYFFRSRARGLVVRAALGAFPFPRRGTTGLERAEATLARGRSVLLFPQGTRQGGPFRPGVGVLAQRGAAIVPVGLAGTAHALPVGATLPRRVPVTVTFGEPVRFDPDTDPSEIAARLEHMVTRCVAGAGRALEAPTA